MDRLILVKAILQIVWRILQDGDGDGRPDLFDSEPQNPEIK